MQVAWFLASRPSRFCSLFFESEGWWFKSASEQYFYHGCLFHYTPQLLRILQDFLLPRDGSHLSAEPKNSECQIFYFLMFSAKLSKFLERTLLCWSLAMSGSKTVWVHMMILVLISSFTSFCWVVLIDFPICALDTEC